MTWPRRRRQWAPLQSGWRRSECGRCGGGVGDGGWEVAFSRLGVWAEGRWVLEHLLWWAHQWREELKMQLDMFVASPAPSLAWRGLVWSGTYNPPACSSCACRGCCRYEAEKREAVAAAVEKQRHLEAQLSHSHARIKVRARLGRCGRGWGFLPGVDGTFCCLHSPSAPQHPA